MDRREKLGRIIGHYELPYTHGRCVRDVVARQPLEWFTDEQLEDIASKLVNDARFSARLNRHNRQNAASRARRCDSGELDSRGGDMRLDPRIL